MVIVAGMLAVPALVMWPPKRVAPTAAPSPGPVVTAVSATAQSKVLRDEPTSEFLTLGMRAAQEGTLHEAAELFRQALDLKPTDAETWNRLGVVLVLQGETARGVDAFARALRLDPGQPEAHRNLAVTRDREGRSDEAVAHYQAFLRWSRADHPALDDVRRRVAELSAPKAPR